jgi:hypothetical protein
VAYTKKIKAGLVPIGIDQFVGDEGTIFYDPAVGDLFLSDGVTPGGRSLGTGSSGIQVLELDGGDASTNYIADLEIDGGEA